MQVLYESQGRAGSKQYGVLYSYKGATVINVIAGKSARIALHEI